MITCAQCGAQNLTPDEMDELAGYPLDHKLMNRFRQKPQVVVLTLQEARALLCESSPKWLKEKIEGAARAAM